MKMFNQILQNLNLKDEDKLKFLFVSLMAVLAFWGRQPEVSTFAVSEEAVRLRVEVAGSQPLQKISREPARAAQAAAVAVQLQELLPYRQNWDLGDPVLNVKSALARSLSNNLEMYQLHADVRWPLASLTKLMSAVVASEEVGLEKVALISETAVAAEGIAGNFRAGESYTISDLVKAMLLVSSNDAATAIAEFYGTENFVNRMQMKARELGMHQTTFVDPTGISFLNQGTITDLEKLVRYIDEYHPEIFQITASKDGVLVEKTKGVERILLNINAFVGSRPDFIGGKTGFTNEANGNLISLFNYRGYKLLFIVLGTDDRFGQTDLLYNWVKEVYAFN
jgi:D-alanyl-D-alanine carboxypeptidase